MTSLRILEDQRFLVVHFDLDLQSYHVGMLDDTELSQTRWNGTTRLSPLWEVVLDEDHVGAPSTYELTDQCCICFLGPIDPLVALNALQTSLISKMAQGQVWVSLGYFNLVLFLKDDDQREIIREFCEQQKCAAEFWAIQGESDWSEFQCDSIDYFEPAGMVIADGPPFEAEPARIQVRDVI